MHRKNNYPVNQRDRSEPSDFSVSVHRPIYLLEREVTSQRMDRASW